MSDQYLSCAGGNCGYCYACWGENSLFATAIAAAKAEGAREERERLRALGPFLDPGNERTDVYNLGHEAGRKQGAKEERAALAAKMRGVLCDLRTISPCLAEQLEAHLKPEAGK